MLGSALALKLNGRLLGEDREFSSLKPIFLAKEEHLSFMLWPQDIKHAKKSKSLLITTIDLAANFLDEINTSVIVINDIKKTFFELTKIISKIDNLIHETALIHKTAVIQGAIIGPNVEIGANSIIGSNAFVPYGEENTSLLPALGGVLIQSGSKIGSLCTVQKGLIHSTSIGKNCLIDDQVHIGHDVVVKDDVIIAGQSALAGFSQVGKKATLGGQVGIGPFVCIGEGARVTAKSGVNKDVKAWQIVSGYPSMEHMKFLRHAAKQKLSIL